MATHNLDLVRRADTRVIQLDRGRIAVDSRERVQRPEAS
jgi:ABC-type ATPase involved in cell division